MPILIDELSLFFPCHNEEENLLPLVNEALTSLSALATRYEVIIVDDGSTDGTAAVAASLVAAHPGVVRLVRHEVNRGYGGARLSVVLKAVRDFWSLRFALWRDRGAALRRGAPLL